MVAIRINDTAARVSRYAGCRCWCLGLGCMGCRAAVSVCRSVYLTANRQKSLRRSTKALPCIGCAFNSQVSNKLVAPKASLLSSRLFLSLSLSLSAISLSLSLSCVCVCLLRVYTYIHTYIYITHACTDACMYVSVIVCVHVCMPRMYVCMYVCTYVCMYE